MTTEQEFLANYDKKAFDNPIFSVDTVLLTYHEGRLKVLLVERSNHPEKNKWGLPGGFVETTVDTCLEDTATRKIIEKTGVESPYLEQLETRGSPTRDKRGWSVTACYTALIAHQQCEANLANVSDARWVDINELNTLSIAFDHADIIQAALARMKQKALYSIIPAYALPEKFTLPELQQLHEALIGKGLQKKSFRRRIEQADLLIDTGEKRSEGGRPASLYTMKQTSKQYTFTRNLEG